jgi:oligopeptide/dipeptide ABC transporter ATP-binding protein
VKADTVLEVENLSTWFHTRKGIVKAVDGVSFAIDKGRIFGIVGESGAGKSITGFSIINLIDPPGRIESGTIRLAGQDIRSLSADALRRLRGDQVSMIFQDPQTSLNPVLSIRRQMFETLTYHNPGLSTRRLTERCLQSLEEVGLPAPRERLGAYPHQLSGGMKQRIVIAMALLNNPNLLIADEPTTALDVTIQAQILLLMKRLCREYGSALILITHDIGVVSQMCDEVAVMYAGKIVERGTRDQVLYDPLHPYTKGLIRCLPRLNQTRQRLEQIKGVMPSLLKLPEGCYFRDRCPEAGLDCRVYPPERELEGRRVTCHRVQ